MTDEKRTPAPADEATDQQTIAAARRPAYDAVFAYIRQLPNRGYADVLRNAMIWRAVTAALDAMKAGMCVSSHCVEGDHVLLERPPSMALEWTLEALRSDEAKPDQYDRIMQAVGSVYAERGWPEDVRALEAMSDAVEALIAAEVARAEQAETAIARVRAIHQAMPEGRGYVGTGYGDISPACSTCGTHDEYAIRWPCGTLRALDEPKETTP